MNRITPALRRLLPMALGCLALFAAGPTGAPTGLRAGISDAGPDATLALILRDIDNNKLGLALDRTNALLKAYPNFRLGWLIQGDLLLARARPLTTFGDVPEGGDRLRDLRLEAIARLKGYRNRPADTQVPRYLLQMEADQKYAVVVDTQRSRLYIYRNENGRPVFVADYYASQGKAGSNKMREGDNKTPLGVYHVTGFIPREKIGDFYGAGAFPINYPNEWDKREGKTGYGIWLHGVPSDTYARPPLASEGCVVISNQDFRAISGYMQAGRTPFIISEGVEWLSLDDWQSERSSLSATIEQWRKDWESRDTGRYLSHYSKDFKSGNQDLAAWSKQKQQVNASKDFIEIDLRALSMFRNPGKDMVVVAFEQDYRSNNLNNVARKRQYWVREGSAWKIIYEGVAS
ncbi:MAG: L,D-transpeptidase family protein [Moraxellaceae bacterium]|nr:L,D-transpeptidase family protein [Moraxellaceae bacterium]